MASKRRSTPLVVEAIEPRILYSADAPALLGADTGLPGQDGGSAPAYVSASATAIQTQSLASSSDTQNQSSQRHEVVLIDGSVPDADALATQLAAGSDGTRLLDVYVIDPAKDGVAQINDILAQYHGNVDAIHLISHGSDGAVQIGNTQLNGDTLLGNAVAISNWGNALTADGDILLYGCDVAADQNGRDFVDALGQLTGADVMASSDLTGAGAQGGNWTLEYSQGHIETGLALNAAQQAAFNGVLATYTVTNTNDAGGGSLRDAIAQANANAGADTITFAISGSGLHTINLLSALPTITGQVTIDGTTQAGYNASTPTPMIELNGASAGGGSDGLFLTSAASGSTIKGLIINKFGGSGIELNGAISNITIQGNYIGTNSAGTVAAGNGAYGVYVDTSASNLTIGGTTADARNVISSNKGAGIFVQNGSNTVILGNHIGVNAMGDGPLGNTLLNATDTGYGIKVVNSTGTVIGNASGGRNVISGNASGGIFITGGSGTSIAGNYIGTTADGVSGIGNGTDGIKLNNTATGNTVTGNLVSGNGQYGVYVVNASNAVIQGNKIGTNLAGNAVLPNTGAGIQVNGSSATIGGTGSGEGNLISGNVGDGIGIVNGSTSVTVQGNYIGTDAAGNVALKNGGSGIYLNNVSGVTIGGSVAGARNIISGNGNRGIFADDATFTVSGNYIGVNASGAALGNTNIGIYLTNGSNNVTIGGAGAGNVIAANGSDGIRIDGSSGITIQGNTIGSTTGAALGNKRQGIYLYTDSTNVLIGGSGAGEGNVIAYNGINGIATAWNPIYGNSFLGNAIYGNGSLASGADATGNYGIDLGTDGVTANDADDVDTGPNDLQNTPVLTSATAAGGNTTVNFTLNSSPSTTYRIEFFANDVNGREGKVYLGYVNVTTNSSGNVTSSKVFSGSYAGKWITATATDTTSTETSEFSATAAVANAAPVITSNGGTATASTSVAENTTAVTTVTATDANGDTLTFSITGGADASKFAIDANTGALQFLTAPNYESPTDTGGDNVYVVTVSVSDGRGGVKAQTLNVTVTNVGTVVTNTNDSGNGSLRQAIIESNQQAGVDTISFAIPGTGVQTIVLQTALPTVTDKVILDGTTQTGWTTTSGPLIELNGAAAAGANGLFIDSGGSGSTIKGLTINRFDANGITLTGASNVTIQGNYIGVNAAGTAISGGSMDSGIYVQGGSGNIIGGTAAGMGNVLSGAGYGVYLNGTNANQVQGNYIGTNAAGTAKLGNVFSGVFINGSSTNNTIGGTTAAAANVIAGNNDGVELSSSGNTVQGNYIGTNANGIKIANTSNGVRINGGANNNTIGGILAGAGNVISGNTYGIIITDANGTLIQGNYIGTNSFSATGLGNALSGVFIRGSSTGNIVGGTTAAARNIISGNKDGVELPASGNTVQGNYIGINVGGTASLANTGFGVRLDSGDGNIIGGTAAGAGNVISGNGTGVDINGATNTLVQGNYIGTDATGTTAIKNTTAGVNIRGSSTGNVIGSTSNGTDTAARNVISGNTEGVIISAASNTVAGNYIGVDKTGVVRLGNTNYGVRINSGGNSNTIGGSTTAARNIISGNHDGVLLAGNNNTVAGNYIGLDINGAVLANGYTGVFVNGGSNNAIGGYGGVGNVISGNGTEGIDIVNGAGTNVLGNYIGIKADGASAAKNGDNGIRIAGATTGTQIVGNVISGNGNNGIYLYNNATGVTIGSNHIGVGFSGTTRVANQNNGIWVDSGSSTITIGGSTSAMRNVISGNDNNGIYLAGTTGVSILGNYIGIDANGTTALGNGIGIYVDSGSSTITIGGTAAGAGNVISGNFSAGVYLQGASTVVLQGNYIGTDKNGTAKVANVGDGINMLGASNVTIGGTAAGAGNVISGNGHVDGNGNKLGDGIWIDRSSNVLIQGNYIGVDKTGAVKLANAADGIGVSSSNSTASTGVTIGGTTTAARNVLSGNGGHGIWIGVASGTTVQNNYIGTNAAGTGAIGNTWDGIEIGAGATNTLIGGVNAGNLISGNAWSGIRIRASGVTVQGNSIGTDQAGTAAIANAEYGIVIYDNVSNIDIGGTASGAGNLISGNTNDGINVEDASVLHIYGNYIGTTAGGNSALGNGGQGIYIGNNSSQVYIGSSASGARNVISGNVVDGVLIGGDSSPVTQVYVQGNYIGIGADGNTDVGNGQHGVDVYGTANGVVVGGGAAGEGNVISGNGVNGITIDANGTVVKRNIIGLNAAATAIVANGNDGISLGPNASNTTIGAGGQGNIIAGNGAYGIETTDSNSTTIQGNTIGTNAGGATGLGNTKAGIFIGAGTTGTLVGGTNAGDGNVIANNGGKGITLEASTSTSGNRFLGNAIYANNGIGIDLGGNGVTANDANDVDTGANALQNFPLLAAAYVTGSNTLILGSFNSTPSRTYRIEFYANDSKDASGNGEGQIYLGYIQITTDASGNASISTTLTGVTAGQWISATATDLTTNNTSEFAADVQAVNNTAPTISSGNTVTAYENSTTVSTVTGNDANGDTLSYSIIGGADAAKFSINSSTGVITFLAAPNYETPGSAAGTNVYTVQVKVDDGKGGTVTQTLTVTVANINEAPAGADNTVTINEDTSYTFVTTDFGFTDTSDNPANSLQAIKIGTISGGGSLTLNGIAVTNGQTITAADITAGKLKFTPAANANGNNYASFTFQVQDNGGTSNGGADTDPTPNTFKFNVTATNDAPVVTSNGGGSTATVSVAENTTAVTTVTAADVDGDTLSYSIVGGADAGKFTIDTGTGALKFIAAPNYEAPGDGNGDNVYVVQIQVADGNGGTVTQTISVTVTDVNEAPSGADNTITMDENTSYVFKAVDFGFSDADGNGMQAVVITTLPGAGTLSLSGSPQPMVPGRVIQLSDIIAGKLKFTPAAGANGNAYASFTFQVQDNGGTSNGGVDTDQTPNTMTFNVTPANRAPSGTDQTATINEDQPYVFNTGDFGFSDPDGNTLQGVKITTIPGAGSLTLDGVAVANGQVVSAADIAAGKLVFTPAANANGNAYASFTFQVQDNGGTNNGGVDLDQSANTFTFNVTAVNDAPVITSGASASTVENSTGVMTVTATDVEGDAATFTIAGGADAAFFTIDNTTGVLKFISAPDHEAALDADGDNVYVVTVNVSDGNGGVTAKTISVTVTDAGYVVTNTNDSGAGSLRQAIIEANQHLGLDTITFAIPGADAQTISVQSALPNITDAVVIDATSQHGYANIPLIEVEGAAAGGAANGFYFAPGASGSTIKGFVINRFGGAGIVLDGVSNITIQGNYIGTDNTGAFAQGNGADGIKIDNGAADIHIGGTTAAARNVISGNLGDGIKLGDASNVYIEGNYIGTDATGTQRVSNIGRGVSMGADADGIIVGGTASGAGNVISGNSGNGVDIDSSTNVFVQGNIIGANKTGTAALNNAWGIYVKDAAGSVVIGGTVAGARNVVSGNVNGIALDNSSGVLVQGNYVGINAAGTAALANDNTGIYVGTNGSGNVIGGTASGAGNVVSGNMGAGIKIEQASGVAIQGNFIGTNAAGNAAVGNGTDGILVVGSSNTTIGGTTAAARNVISGNSSDGIEFDSASTNNSVLGNFIGTDVSGAVDLGNGDNGIRLSGANTTIGGTAAGAGNLISGNGQNGIEVRNTSGTVIQGNTIGTDLSGMADLGNTWAGIDLGNVTGATIGGTGTAKNLISGNDRDGIYAAAIANTTISGNTIGLNATGTAQLANGGAGIELSNSSNNVIGGAASGAGNVVSGNGAQGIVLHSGSASNTVQGNLIGTNAAGTAAIGNSWSGLEIDASNNNVVGGTGSGEGNLISGNQQAGVLIKGATTGTLFVGNKVGTNLAGNAKVGNVWSGVTIADGMNNTIDSNLISGNVGDGIELAGNATNNTVSNNIIGLDATGKTALGNWDGIAVSGSSNTIDGNTVSGNAQTGIVLNGGTGNTVTDNIIGLDITGKTVVTNGSGGIRIANGASANIIGGSGAGDANTIAGNLNYGIVIDGASGNIVQGNYIGTNATGDTGLGNGLGGINFDNAATGNLIGGTNAGEGNVIANNGGNGITAFNVAGVSGNRFLGNTIYGNSAIGIDLGNDGVTGNDSGDGDTGPNGMQNFPLLAGAYVMGSNTLILGSFNSTPSRTYRIEFYANDSKDASGNGEGQIYLGYIQITTDASGNASISTTLTGVTAGQWISATATDLTTNNTSEFAADVQAVNNTAPTISSGNTVTAYENSTTVSTVTGNDANGDTLSYSIIGGADAAKFSINSSTGVITFLAAPNYETPGSAAGTNVYTVQVKVDDGKGGTVTQTLTVTVANINEAPAGADNTVTINEDTSYTFVTTDFGFTDTSDNPANSLQAIKIGTISGGGSLTLNGIAVTNGQTITAADITAGKLKFTPAANANGNNYASFTFQVQDNGGTSNGGADTDPTPNTFTFNVTAINDAPSGTDKLVTIDEDGSYTFDPSDFGFSDVDGNSLQAIKIGTISGGGTLTLNGVAVQAGDTIAVAQIGNLKFTPAANANGNNYASFTFQMQDNGGTSNGGVDTDQSANTITFNITSINDAPSGTDKLVTIDEDGSYTFGLSDFGFSDVDGNSLQAIKIGTISGGGTLTLNGVAVQAGDTIAVAQIGNLKFTPTANANGNNYASFTFQVQDNGGTSNGGVDTDQSANTITFNITSINDAPSGTDKLVTIDEDGSYTFGLSDFGFSDADGNAFNGVKITSIPGAGTLTLDGVAVTNGQTISVADIAAGKLVFSPAANANGNAYASFSFQVQDNGGTSNGGVDTDQSANTFTFNVTSINDAPSGTDKTVTIDEDGSYTFTATDFGFSDIDGNSLQAIKIGTISGGGTLMLDGVAVTAGQTISVADINSGKLKFSPAANANGNGYASFTFQVQDNGGTSNGGVDTDQSANTFTFNVTSINDAPSGADKTVTIDEDGSYTFTGTDFGFNDIDGNSLQGVKITTIPGAGTLTLDGVAVTAGQTISVADINSGKLKFSPAANANGNAYASFTFQVQDNGGTSNGGVDTDQSANTFTFNVTSINDAPAGTDKLVTIDEDGSYTFTATDFGFSDIDGNSLQGVKITTIPGAGTLTLDGVAVTAGQTISVADINSGKLKFSPAANANGNNYASISFQVQDNGGTSDGGVDTDQSANTFTFNVTSINDEPSGTDKTVTINEDGSYTFTATDFGFSDVDGNSLQAIKIGTISGGGTLTLNGVAVQAGDIITVGQIGNLKFTPAANANGNNYASFTFQVQDNGGTSNGGIDTDQSANTFTINVAPVNDAPVITSNGGGSTASVTMPENATSVTTVVGSDVENDTLTYSIIGGADSAKFSIDASTGLLTFITAPDFETPTDADLDNVYVVTVQVSDGNGGTVTQTISVTLANANEAPVITSDGGGNTAAVPVYENGTTVTTVIASDVDHDTLTYSISGGADGGSFSIDASTGALRFIAAPNFELPADADGDNVYEVQVTVADGNGGIATQTISVTIRNVNEAPTGADKTVTTNEDTGYVLKLEDFGFADVDNASNLNAVRITAIPTAGTLTLNGVAVQVNDVITASDIAAGKLVFAPAGNANGANYAGFSFRVQDDGGTANGGVDWSAASNTITINVTSVNDAPTGADKTVVTNEDTPYVFKLSDFDFADANDAASPNALLAVKITSLPANGVLMLGTTAVSVGQFVSAADIAAGKLVFVPVANANGANYAGFTFQVQDNGGTANGGVDLSAVRSMRIDVASVNDAPSATDNAVTTQQGSPYVFRPADFGFSDVDGNGLLAVKIGTLPAVGRLTLDGAAVSAGQTIAAADIAAGKLRFVPAVGASAAGRVSFSFQVQDDGGMARGGSDVSAASTMTVNLTALPELGNPTPPVAPGKEPDVPAQSGGNQGGTTRPVVQPVTGVDLEPIRSIAPPPAAAFDFRPGTARISTQSDVVSASASRDGVGIATPQSATLSLGSYTLLQQAYRNGFAQMGNGEGGTLVNGEGYAGSRTPMGDIKTTTGDMPPQTIEIATAVTTLGTVWMVARRGALAASMLASVPAWVRLDPLPVLGMLNGEKEKSDDDIDMADHIFSEAKETTELQEEERA